MPDNASDTKWYECPISKESYEEPSILLGSGQTIEKSYIIQWLQTKPACPLTNISLDTPEKKKVVLNKRLHAIIKKLTLIAQQQSKAEIEHIDYSKLSEDDWQDILRLFSCDESHKIMSEPVMPLSNPNLRIEKSVADANNLDYIKDFALANAIDVVVGKNESNRLYLEKSQKEALHLQKKSHYNNEMLQAVSTIFHKVAAENKMTAEQLGWTFFSKADKEKIAKIFSCEITGCIFLYPVLNLDTGKSYEASAVGFPQARYMEDKFAADWVAKFLAANPEYLTRQYFSEIKKQSIENAFAENNSAAIKNYYAKYAHNSCFRSILLNYIHNESIKRLAFFNDEKDRLMRLIEQDEADSAVQMVKDHILQYNILTYEVANGETVLDFAFKQYLRQGILIYLTLLNLIKPNAELYYTFENKFKEQLRYQVTFRPSMAGVVIQNEAGEELQVFPDFFWGLDPVAYGIYVWSKNKLVCRLQHDNLWFNITKVAFFSSRWSGEEVNLNDKNLAINRLVKIFKVNEFQALLVCRNGDCYTVMFDKQNKFIYSNKKFPFPQFAPLLTAVCYLPDSRLVYGLHSGALVDYNFKTGQHSYHQQFIQHGNITTFCADADNKVLWMGSCNGMVFGLNPSNLTIISTLYFGPEPPLILSLFERELYKKFLVMAVFLKGAYKISIIDTEAQQEKFTTKVVGGRFSDIVEVNQKLTFFGCSKMVTWAPKQDSMPKVTDISEVGTSFSLWNGKLSALKTDHEENLLSDLIADCLRRGKSEIFATLKDIKI